MLIDPVRRADAADVLLALHGLEPQAHRLVGPGRCTPIGRARAGRCGAAVGCTAASCPGSRTARARIERREDVCGDEQRARCASYSYQWVRLMAAIPWRPCTSTPPTSPPGRQSETMRHPLTRTMTPDVEPAAQPARSIRPARRQPPVTLTTLQTPPSTTSRLASSLLSTNTCRISPRSLLRPFPSRTEEGQLGRDLRMSIALFTQG